MIPFAESFHILDKVDSTNNYAMGLVHSGKARDGWACFALDQTKGKGRRGKVWDSRKSQNIIMSITVKTTFLPIYRQYYLSAAVALSCSNLLNIYTLVETKIKWPNDIFLNDRKAGGILIENVVQGSLWQWAVIGIGINVNQTLFSPGDNKRTSLRNVTGLNYDVIELGRELHQNILAMLNKLKGSEEGNLMEQFNNKLYKLNETVRLKKQNMVFDTLVTGVSKEGQLITFDVMEKRYNIDEVEWIL